jgi:hypothetical protein
MYLSTTFRDLPEIRDLLDYLALFPRRQPGKLNRLSEAWELAGVGILCKRLHIFSGLRSRDVVISVAPFPSPPLLAVTSNLVELLFTSLGTLARVSRRAFGTLYRVSIGTLTRCSSIPCTEQLILIRS